MRGLILPLKRLKRLMPKFYHGTACGVSYSARAVGFWRRFPCRFFPYLTGDVVKIHLRLKREACWWPEAILRIDPPIVSDMSNMPGGWSGKPIVVSNFVFRIKDIDPGEVWSDTLSLMGGITFGQSRQVKCYVDLQKVDGNKAERGTLHVADIEVAPRGQFMTNIVLWGFTTVLAIILGVLGIVW